LSWDELPTAEAEAFTISTVPERFASIGDPGAGIDDAVGSLEALLELSRRDEAEGLGDAPWPPNYRKQEGEPPRVQPSRQRRAAADYDTPEAEAEREKNRAAMENRFAAEIERRVAAKAAGDPTPATKPTPTGRRRLNVPVIEISRAKTKDEALEGLERWKVRHPEAAAALDVADVLVDGMRGRSSLWYRVRVNLAHVPEADRPPQEPLDPDYDPWAEYAWPDRAGQLERAPRRRAPEG
jgi:bifunctional non-homologous end joining protein LigD